MATNPANKNLAWTIICDDDDEPENEEVLSENIENIEVHTNNRKHMQFLRRMNERKDQRLNNHKTEDLKTNNFEPVSAVKGVEPSSGGENRASVAEVPLVSSSTPATNLESIAWMKDQLHGWGLGLDLVDEDWGAVIRIHGLEDLLRGLVMDRFRQQRADGGAEKRASAAEVDLLRLEDKHHRLETALQMRTQDVATLESRLAKATSEAREQRRRWLEEREGLCAAAARLAGRDQAYQAQARKHEQQYARLQDRLQRMSAASDRGNKRAIELKRPAPAGAAAGQRAGGPGAAADNGNGSGVIGARLTAAHLERLEGLMLENEQLRQMLLAVQGTARELGARVAEVEAELRQRRAPEEEEAEEADPRETSGEEGGGVGADGPLELAAGHFGMPLEWLEEHVGERLHRQLLRLQERMARLPHPPGAGDEGGEAPAPAAAAAAAAEGAPPCSSSPAAAAGAAAGAAGEEGRLRRELADAWATVEAQDAVIREALFGPHRPIAVAAPGAGSGAGPEAGASSPGAWAAAAGEGAGGGEEEDLSGAWARSEELAAEGARLAALEGRLAAEAREVARAAQRLADDQLQLEQFKARMIYGDVHSDRAGTLLSATPFKATPARRRRPPLAGASPAAAGGLCPPSPGGATPRRTAREDSEDFSSLNISPVKFEF